MFPLFNLTTPPGISSQRLVSVYPINMPRSTAVPAWWGDTNRTPFGSLVVWGAGDSDPKTIRLVASTIERAATRLGSRCVRVVRLLAWQTGHQPSYQWPMLSVTVIFCRHAFPPKSI